MNVRDRARAIVREHGALLAEIDAAALTRACDLLATAPRVFVCGQGRSGLIMRMLAVRLLHLGRPVHVIGETTTPPIAAGDLLIVCSGSGRTSIPQLVADRAVAAGATLLLFSAVGESPIAALADTIVVVPAPPKGGGTDARSHQYEGSLFEQAVLLLCDACFETLRTNLGLGPDDLRAAHANLE